MTDKDFINWLRGYIEGRLPHLEEHHTGYEILKTIQSKLDEEDNQLDLFEDYFISTT